MQELTTTQSDTQELTISNTTPPSSEDSRDEIKKITTEILQHKATVVHSFIQIGKLLDEAKGHLKKEGQWLKWLETSVDISVRMAQRYIQLYKAFPDATSVTPLGMTKALALLPLPEAQRESFINKPHEINGKPKNISDMSVREIRNIVREQTKPAEKSTKASAEPVEVTNKVGRSYNQPIPRSSTKNPTAEIQPEPPLEALTSDIKSAQTHPDGILKILESQTADDTLQGKIADELRSLHEKVQKCLRLVEVPADCEQ